MWTAEPGAEIVDGQFQEFEVSAGPLPDAGTRLVLPAHQTYTDGTVVDWVDVAEEGGEEPAHPAPELTTTDADVRRRGRRRRPRAVTASTPTTSSPTPSPASSAGSVSPSAPTALVVVLLGRRRRGDA